MQRSVPLLQAGALAHLLSSPRGLPAAEAPSQIPDFSEKGAGRATGRGSPGPATRVGARTTELGQGQERRGHVGAGPHMYMHPSCCPSRAALGGHQRLGGATWGRARGLLGTDGESDSSPFEVVCPGSCTYREEPEQQCGVPEFAIWARSL